jgi:DNA polymerase (family 10)
VPGFGKKSAEALLESIAAFREQRNRIPRYVAESIGRTALHSLRQMANGRDVALVGGIRRLADTVESVDLLAADDDPEAILDAFGRLSLWREVEREGAGTATARTRERYPVRLYLVAPRVWGAALQHFTGSPAHNAQLLERAQAIGRAVPPNGGTAEAGPEWRSALAGPDGTPIEGTSEDDVYAALGLPVIPPELREGRGEIAAALTGTLPDLIRVEDIRGDLHLHTTWSDGKHSVEQMARKGRALGYEYIAIADHSQSLGVARGLSLERLAAQRQEIREADDALDGIRLLSSVELDIKHDGSLDYPDEVLAEFDFVTASIHSGFQQPREQLTQRVIAAMRSPHVDAIGHLTGRVLGRRPPLDMDVDATLDAAAETGTALEINAWPNRLDVHEDTARRAKERGIKLVINTDSHAEDQMDYMHYGVEIARRAWLTAADVLNTLSLDALLAYLRSRPGKR